MRVWLLIFLLNAACFALGVWANGLGWLDVVNAVLAGYCLGTLMELLERAAA
jgi:uncharacterized membrane protein YjjP (DUF1212 family)